METARIERDAHSVHREIWLRRHNIWPMGLPPVEAMLSPHIAARVLDLEYDVREAISGDGSRQFGAEAGGFLDRGRGIIAISAKCSYEVQRYTGAHEVGHAVMHPWIGDKVVHRDLPVGSASGYSRAPHEREADYFAACYLMPRKLVEKELAARFGSKKPLPRDETVAFHLRVVDTRGFFSASADSLMFASIVARAQSFGRGPFKPLTSHFGVSAKAMAIRLQELGLIEE
jgi:Zn-dependent peptidase ImmA (M78 family)